MPRIRVWNGGAVKPGNSKYEFTVVLVPVYEEESSPELSAKKDKKTRLPNPLKPRGYQVAVPLLPGLVTFGRTKAEAKEMAQDAIRCHIEGLKKDGLAVPDERFADFRKFRISA